MLLNAVCIMMFPKIFSANLADLFWNNLSVYISDGVEFWGAAAVQLERAFAWQNQAVLLVFKMGYRDYCKFVFSEHELTIFGVPVYKKILVLFFKFCIT